MKKQRTKSGVVAAEAQAQGYSQVFGMPGVAFAKAGRLFNGALVEVDDKGDRLESLIIEPAAVEVVAPADASPEEAAVTNEADDDTQAAADEAKLTNTEDVGAEPTTDSKDIADLRAKIAAAEADLKGWMADNDATTTEGKKEYAKIYGRVRRAKDAFAKAGGKLD